MPVEAIYRAATEVTNEIAKEVSKESREFIRELDKPLNSLDVKETSGKEMKEVSLKEIESADKMQDLDKPLNYVDHNDAHGESEELQNIEAEGNPEADKPEEFDENGFRELTDSEKAELSENTKWSEKAIDRCKISEGGVIKYPCRNEELAGKTNELTGVKYEKKIIDVYGYKVEVVMPEFDSAFEAQLPDELTEVSDREQFKECNKQLADAIKEDPDLAECFSEEQIEQINEGITKGGAPDGYTWHHDAETGKMQLVDSDLHGDSRHTGGRAIWGGGSEFR
ncbi:MAG: HNH endonuclease [Dorea sp.]|jgi:hypothetical protein|nr:HNH endonuclease [Dorea sp.]